MSDFTNSRFQLLPEEILIKILAKVDTFSLINFCKVYQECSYAYQEKSVVRTLTFYKVYALTAADLQSFSKKLLMKHVVVLNLNCVYWVTSTILRRFMCKMVELKELYAIDTELSLTLEDIQTYRQLPKLKKLAVTIHAHDKISVLSLPNISVLYVDFVPRTEDRFPLEKIFPGLLYIWWNCHYISSINPTPYSKIFSKITGTPSGLIRHTFELRRYHNNRRMCQPMEICCEEDDPSVTYKSDEQIFSNDVTNGQVWKVLYGLRYQVPYGPRDARKLRWNQATLQTLFFEDLNFHHVPTQCSQICKNAFREILKLPNMKYLKRLTIMMCLTYYVLEEDSSEDHSFKRRRVGVGASNISHPFAEIVENIPHLETLEIFHCCAEPLRHGIEAFALIAKFRHLKYLSLQIPVFVNGKFLAEVLKSCKSLEVLKIECLTQNENLNYYLSKALPEATALKDFRYENFRIQIDRIMEGLALIPTRKLERIVLICQNVNIFSASPLNNVLQRNDQLIFFYIDIHEATNRLLRTVRDVLSLYNRKHPARSYIIKNTKETPTRGFPFPDVHFKEMIMNNSTVACLRDYEDVLTF